MTGNDEEAHYWDLSKCRQARVCTHVCVCVQPLGRNVVKNISEEHNIWLRERGGAPPGCEEDGANAIKESADRYTDALISSRKSDASRWNPR